MGASVLRLYKALWLETVGHYRRSDLASLGHSLSLVTPTSRPESSLRGRLEGAVNTVEDDSTTWVSQGLRRPRPGKYEQGVTQGR